MTIRTVSFQSSSSAVTRTGWQGEGSGTITTELPNDATIVFNEAGIFHAATGSDFPFTNVFRWTLLDAETIRLEHLRFGLDNPVVLFDLTPVAEKRWTSALGHQCRDDCYTADVELLDDHLRIIWTVHGPKKAERIEYLYR
jgi:hypothetical protein